MVLNLVYLHYSQSPPLSLLPQSSQYCTYSTIFGSLSGQFTPVVLKVQEDPSWGQQG